MDEFLDWTALTETSHEVYAKPKMSRHHALTDIEYERLKFSHDRVSIDLIDHVVTEKGAYKPEKLKEVFKDMFKKRAKKRERYFGEE